MNNNFISAIITAAGSGSRMASGVPKLELKIKDRTILDIGLEKFTGLEEISEIILVANPELLDEYREKYKDIKKLKVIKGGKSREESTRLGLEAVSNKASIIVCHDGARPFVDQDLIKASIESARKYGSGVAGVPTIDTIKIRKDNKILEGLDRSNLINIQTPQTFQADLIKKAYGDYYGKIKATDDSEFVRALGEDIYLVESSYDNFKITTKRDYLLAKLIMEEV